MSAANAAEPSAKKDSEKTAAGAAKWAAAADLIVVGGGGAGFAAAIQAARDGASVIVLEKNTFPGGDTVRSGGMIMAGGTQIQADQGVEDSVDNFAATELGYCGDTCNSAMVEEMCRKSLDIIKFMQDLGRDFNTLTPMNPVYGYDTAETWAPRTHWDANARTGHFILLYQEAVKLGVQIYTDTEVVHLVQDDEGAVIGVTDANGVAYRANKGVVISTASFGNNREMSLRYNKMNAWTLGFDQFMPNAAPEKQSTRNTGDGIRMAQEIGADLALSPANCVVDVCATSFAPTAHTILVNRNGDRFVQESAQWGYLNQMCYNEAVKTGATELGKVYSWIIADSRCSELNVYLQQILAGQQGMAGPAYFPQIVTANTIEELAEQTGLPADELEQTVARWNELSEAGEDKDFHRDYILGETELGTIEEPPFYAFPYIPFSMGSFGGLRTDEETNVLDVNGQPIARLYAAGAAMSGMFTAPFYNACGWSVLGTMVWGLKAGKNVAALDTWTDEPVENTVEVPDLDKLANDGIAKAAGSYQAGTYNATGVGRVGEIPVTVEFSDKAITAITVGDNQESAGIGSWANEIYPKRVLAAQTTDDVDVVSGATITSAGIRMAIDDCIAQAAR